MSLGLRHADSAATDVAEVRKHPLGTRFLCRENGKTYQLGAKHGMSEFWMLEEGGTPTKGKVNARVILEHFEVIR